MRARWQIAAVLAAALAGCSPRQLATKERLPKSVLRAAPEIVEATPTGPTPGTEIGERVGTNRASDAISGAALALASTDLSKSGRAASLPTESVLVRRPDRQWPTDPAEPVQRVVRPDELTARPDDRPRPADALAHRTEPVFPKRISNAVLKTASPERPVRDTDTLRSDRMVIDAILADLEAVDPDRVPEFIEVIRQSAGSENFAQILRTWQATVSYQARVSGRRASTVTSHSTSGEPLTRPLAESAQSGRPGRSTNRDRADTAVQPAALQQQESGPLLIPQTIGSTGQAAGKNEAAGTTRITYRAPAEAATTGLSGSVPTIRGSEPGPGAGLLDAQLRRLADAVEQQNAQSSDEQWKQQVQSRLLYLLSGDAQRAVKPLVGMPPHLRDFWRNQLWALARAFETGNDLGKAGEMLTLLNEALLALQQQAGLAVTVPVFCREVTNFGNYREFESNDFVAGTKVVVYWEVKNFASVEQPDGFHTRLAASIEIFDHTGKSVHRSEHPFPDDVCRQRRHDYFNAVLFQLPKDLRPGRHVLKVTVRDITADRIAEKQREFIVR